jgi:hypothetical protein
MRNNPSKSNLEYFKNIFIKFKKIQFGLSNSYQNNNTIKKQILNACQGIKDYNPVL